MMVLLCGGRVGWPGLLRLVTCRATFAAPWERHAVSEPAAVEREDLVVEPDEPPLALADDLRGNAPIAVAGSVDPDRALIG